MTRTKCEHLTNFKIIIITDAYISLNLKGETTQKTEDIITSKLLELVT